MDENKVVEIIKEYFEGQYPKTCSNCGMVFNSIAEYLRNTTHLGDPISYDAEMDDWKPEEPIGTLSFSNCKCGSTLAVSTKDMDRLTLWRLMLWLRLEAWKRGISMNELMRDIRSEIRRRVLSDD
jgi:hypothetical protein